MTNMEGVGLLFISFFIGVPILCFVIILSYLAHRWSLKSENQIDAVIDKDKMPVSIADATRDVFLTPDPFFKRITSNKLNLFRPLILVTISGVILDYAILTLADSFYWGSGLFSSFFYWSELFPLFCLFCRE